MRAALILTAITGIAAAFCGSALGAIRGCSDGRIAFDSLRGGKRDIYVIPAPAKQGQPPAPDATPLQLTTGADDEKPSWSPPDPSDTCPENAQAPTPGSAVPAQVSVPMIAFQRTTPDGNTNIFAINPAAPEPGRQAIQITHDGADTAPAWAPAALDGTPPESYPPIAFVRSVNGHHDIFIANYDGTDETDLTNSTGADYGNPDFSSLGDTVGGSPPQTLNLAFDSDHGGQREIWVMDIAYQAGNPPGHRYVNLGMREVTRGQPVSSNPSWFTFNANGDPLSIVDSIAFAGPDQNGESSQINIAQPTAIDDGTVPPFSAPSGIDYSALTNDSTGDSAPAWAPTGDFIAFQKASAGGRSDIYVLDPTGNDETGDLNLTKGVGDNRNPDWEPVQFRDVQVFPIRPLGRRHRARLAEGDVLPQTPKPPTPAPPSTQPPPSPAFAAQLLSMRAIGHGRGRTVLIRFSVNEAVSVTAVLQPGHRRPVRQRWLLGAGTELVRLRVPLSVRPGTYAVRVTVQPANGSPESFGQRVHVGR